MAFDPKDRLYKALASRANTSQDRPVWDELLTRYVTLPALKSLQAAEVLEGFVGSWAAQWGFGAGVRTPNANTGGGSLRFKEYRLGQPGMGEINFRPYDFGTNRQGSRGPSLLGHPISFAPLGPTAKTRFNDWQWLVTDNSATPGTGDVLTLDQDDNVLSTQGDPVAATFTTIESIYGITEIPSGGLYMVVLMTGAPGSLDSSGDEGGLGDGSIGDSSGDKQAVTAKKEYSKFEIFRVVDMDETSLTLDSSKRLSTYFTVPGGKTPVIRSIMLVQPKASRVVAVPGSGQKVFAILPPEKALNADFMPPYSAWTMAAPYAFTAWNGYSGSDTANSDDYNDNVALPMAKPVRHCMGRVLGTATDPSPTTYSVQRWALTLDVGVMSEDDIGRVIRIYDVETFGDVTLNDTLDSEVPVESLLGWYEVADYEAVDSSYSRVVLKRVADFDPQTGMPFFAPMTAFQLAFSSDASERIEVKFTVHEPISHLWTQTHIQLEDVLASKLTNLIDPSLVGVGSGKAYNLLSVPTSQATPASSVSRADRAIFNTASSNEGVGGSNADPGSLLDLGFRVVLFPGKHVGGVIVPDFDRPIASNRLVLDASRLDEEQYFEVDYASGLIYLSHTPTLEAGGDLLRDENILEAADNPRGEVTFFVSCVPYSQESGQMGVGVHVSAAPQEDVADCAGNSDFADVYSQRLWYPLDSQTLTVPTHPEKIDIELSTTIPFAAIPETGFVEILAGIKPGGAAALFDDAGEGAHRVAVFGYTSVGSSGHTLLQGCWGGGNPGDTIVVNAHQPHIAVFRRNISLPSTGKGEVGTDYREDLSYGSADRSKALRFKNASLAKLPDGSTVVEMADPRAVHAVENFNDIFSSWILSGGTLTGSSGLTQYVGQTVCLLQGQRVTIPGGSVTLTDNTVNYVFVRGEDPCAAEYAVQGDASPLTSQHDVLLYKIVMSGGVRTEIVDMRHPLTDTDLRLDVIVGQKDDWLSLGALAPHFTTLYSALAYVGEILHPESGFDGRYIRIRVVGYTFESTVPIPLNVEGLVIEGVARRTNTSDSDGARHGIHWSASDTALFDVTEILNVTFKNLAFFYDDEGQSDLDDPTQVVFQCVSDQSMRNCLFEDLYFDGSDRAHGFCVLGGAALDVRDVSFVRCVVENTTDFGWYVYNETEPNHVTWQDCVVTGATSGYQLSILTQASVLVENVVSVASRVSGCKFSGFQYGIHDEDGYLSCENNFITGTVKEGIFLESGGIVRGNTLDEVHTATDKVGIYVGAASTVESNVITLSSPSLDIYPTHLSKCISVAGSRSVIRGNRGDKAIYLVADNCIVEGNLLSDGGISIEGTGNVIKGNVALCDTKINPSTGFLSLNGNGNLAEGNIFDGGITINATAYGCFLLGRENMVRGNTFDMGLTVGFSGLGDDTQSQNNLIADNTFTSGLDAADFLTVTSTGVNTRVTGNRCHTLTVNAPGCLVSNNITEEDLVLNLDHEETFADIGSQVGMSSTQIKLAGGNAANNYYNGKWVQHSTTKEYKLILAYNGTTKVADVTPAWGTQPVDNDEVIVYDNFAAYCISSGNYVKGTLTLVAGDNILALNQILTNMVLDGNRAVVHGNHIAGDFSGGAAGPILVGNHFANATNMAGLHGSGDPDDIYALFVGNASRGSFTMPANKAANMAVTGNYIADTFDGNGSYRYTLVGNRFMDDIDVSASVNPGVIVLGNLQPVANSILVGSAPEVLVVGNFSGQVDVAGDTWIVVANNLDTGIDNSAAPGVDPDSASFSSILVGNKLGNATSQFGGAPDGDGRQSNVQS